MLRLQGLTIKNFMSIGNVTQSINFGASDLILVLGEKDPYPFCKSDRIPALTFRGLPHTFAENRSSI